ncbi:hypothetical protein B0J14DRAFT_569180 [Halenospora varia]|nr:hypothetical protein B0J14DRAFT_569180 [Halenospora varia]
MPKNFVDRNGLQGGAAQKAQEAEDHRLAKLREVERKREFINQQDEQRRRDRQARDESAMRAHLRYKAAIEAQKAQEKLIREAALRANAEDQNNKRAMRDDHRRREREQRDYAGMLAHLRHEADAQARRSQLKSLTEQQIVAYDGPIPSFLDQEYQYMKEASTTFLEAITSSTQMSCMKSYQKAISDVSRRLPCGLCWGLFQEDRVLKISLQDANLLSFFEKTKTEPDYCAVKDYFVSLCSIYSSTVAKRAIPPLSAGNFVNCLFCQDYPAVLKNLNTVKEAFIARAHVISMFLKLTSGAQKGISYRGSRGYCVAVKQDPNLWPDNHIPQEIRDAFIALGPKAESTQGPVTNERDGYATSLQGGLFENDLDAEVDNAEPGSILNRSFFSDFHGQDPQSTPATLASLQAILEDEDLGSSVLIRMLLIRTAG